MADTDKSTLSDLQADFLETYVLKSGRLVRNKKKKNAELTQLMKTYTGQRDALRKTIDGLREDDTMRGGFSNMVLKADELIKGKGNTADNIKAASYKLQEISLAVDKHMKLEEENARKFSLPGQVRFFISKAQAEMFKISGEFTAEVNQVVDKITELAGETVIVIPEPKLAQKMENAVSAAQGAINPLSTAAASGDMTLELAKSIIDDVVKGIVQTDKDLRAELATFADNEEKIKQHIENVRKAEDIKDDIDSMGPFLDELQTWEAPTTAALFKQAEEIKKAAHPEHGDLDGLKKSCDTLMTEIKSARMDVTTAYVQQRDALLARLAKTWNVIDAHKKKHAKEAMPEQIEEFNFVANAARQALNVGKNAKALPAIEKMIVDAENLANDLGSMGVINGEVKKAIAAAKKIVGKRHGKKDTIRVNAWTALDAEITGFESDWPSKRPATARSEVIDLAVRCGEEEKREAAQHTWMESQKVRIAESRKLLAKVEEQLKQQMKATGDKFDGYEGALKKELDDAETFLTKEAVSWQQPTETKIGRAQVAIAELLGKLGGSQTEMVQALKGLVEEHESIVAAKDEELQALGKLYQSVSGWKDVSKAMYKKSKTAKSHKEDYEPLMKQVSSFLSEVKKASKTKDPSKRTMDSSTVEKRYRGYQQRMQTILKDPPKINRKMLGTMDATWKAAVGRMGENQGTLVNTIKNDFLSKLDDSSNKTQLLDAVTKFNAQLDTVVGTFDLKAFDAAAKVLGDETATEKDRLRHREIALNMVRLNRDRITGNPLIQTCVMNPFNVPGFASPPFHALNQIDLEVQRGV